LFEKTGSDPKDLRPLWDTRAMCFRRNVQRNVLQHWLSQEEREQEERVAQVPPPCFPFGSSGDVPDRRLCQLAAESRLKEGAQRAAEVARFRKAAEAQAAAAAAYDAAQRQALEEPVLGQSRRTEQPIAKRSVRTPS
jgi:hypothetical protein